MVIIVIGRGHSGTRIIAQTLYASNVYMGRSKEQSALTWCTAVIVRRYGK